MKSLSLPICLVSTLLFPPVPVAAQNAADTDLFLQRVAQSGCCKARQSDKHPWVKNGMGYRQCEDINESDGDKIFKKSGKYWWDRSC